MKKLQTELSDRVLRFDGVSVLSPEQIPNAIVLGVHPSKIRTTESSEDIQLFNSQVQQEEQIHLDAEEPIRIDMNWILPPAYNSLNILERVLIDFEALSKSLRYTEEQIESGAERISKEIHQIEVRGMEKFIRTIIYILDTFKKEGIVWGVGRGSSCACYILFIIGMHSVDSLLLEIPLDEFFHD